MKRVVLALLTAAIFLTACGSGDPWYGKGTVFEKDMRDNITTMGPDGPQKHKFCYHLGILDDHGVERHGCVSEIVWNDAMPGHHIEITKEYN